MKRVRLLFMGREQNPFEDVPALYELGMGRSVSGKKWKGNFYTR